MQKLASEAVRQIRDSGAWIPEIGKGTGWRPEPEDERDFRLKSLLGSTSPPARASIREHVPPVRDQGYQGACTGFATANAIGTLVRRASHWATIYSPQFLYNLARQAIGELHLDEGAYIRDAVKVATNIGAARESDFPYYEIQDIQFAPPPPKAFDSARSFRLGGYYRCNSLADVKRAIAAGYPVVFGFLCYSNLYQAWGSGRIPEPSGSVDGGHAVMAAEYDDATRYVSGPNSWSRQWGDKGWFHLPYSFFEGGHCSDMWALVDEAPETRYPNRAAA